MHKNKVLSIMFLLLSLPSCSNQIAKRSVTSDVVFCYMPDVYVDDAMTNWGCYSDYTCFNGSSYFEVLGKRHTPHGNIDYNQWYKGRIFSFASKNYIEGGTYGIGYVNSSTNKTEVAISTLVIKRIYGEWLSLSINSNYTSITNDTKWSVPNLDTRTFASMIMPEFNVKESGIYGYDSFKVLKETFIDNLIDYNDELAKNCKWIDESGVETNLYDSIKEMEKNYNSVSKNKTKGVLNWVSFITGVGILFSAMYFVYRKYRKGMK